MTRYLAVGLVWLSACAAGPSPTPEPRPAAEPEPARASDDPLADIEAAAAIVLRDEAPRGFDACQTLSDEHVIALRGKMVEVGQARMFDGCERNIVTPFSVVVEEVLEGDLSTGQTITVWQEGGTVKTPEGRTVSAYASHSCGRLGRERDTMKICVQRAGPDFVPACCPGQGSR